MTAYIHTYMLFFLPAAFHFFFHLPSNPPPIPHPHPFSPALL